MAVILNSCLSSPVTYSDWTAARFSASKPPTCKLDRKCNYGRKHRRRKAFGPQASSSVHALPQFINTLKQYLEVT
ncbi:unnamed protein product [Leptidea sinapis]|uniref:Uncharacterized protein n=1 Tax=Leptidea sinapis TaxID=189913 RepID=A0A5E4PR57_9NEOP|nr:unnamed protein product [Leptidea sinapis]